MSIGFGHLTSLLAALYKETDGSSLEARVRYFQRRGFPNEDAAVGKGWRAEYGAAEVVKLVCALELLIAFVPPAQASAVVQSSWRDVDDFLRSAWIERHRTAASRPLRLSGLGVGAKGETEGVLTAATADQVRAWLQGSGEDRAVLLFDAARLMRALDSAMGSSLPTDRADRMRKAMEEWAGAR